MGTNFYAETVCAKCGNSKREHIGKRSAGWTFTFRARPLIRDYDAWRTALDFVDIIVDENGNRYTVGEMVEIVMDNVDASRNHAIEYPENRTYLDKYGNAFIDGEFS